MSGLYLFLDSLPAGLHKPIAGQSISSLMIPL